MPPEDGQRSGNIETVEMLSSAVPPTPVIIDVVPILTWKEDGALATGYSSTRRGIGLRVWLRRPWFGSGAGEMLGVVCRNDGIVGTEYREITYMARDPVHGGIVPFPLGTDGLIGAEARLKNIEVRTALGVVNAALATFKPRYDPNRDAWYCDLQFNTGAAYFPFVRLGLVRYQPRSIPGCETSDIVATSFVQTLPDRTLSVVQQSPQALSVRMHGPAPQSRRALDDTVVTETNLVVAVIEEQDARVNDIALGWTAIGGETVLAAEIQADGLAVWSGDVPLTAGGGGARRLCVREFELHPADDRSAVGAFVVARRLVHADVLALDGL